MGKKNNNSAPQPKKGGKKADDEFDAFLKELSVATATTGKAKAAETKAVVPKAKASVAKQEPKMNDLEQMILQHQRQQHIQMLLQQMMRGGGSPFGNKANTDFDFQAAESDKYKACCGWMQGWRSNMEDAHVIIPAFKKEDNAGLFAVFDGHGGAKCAQLCQAVLPVTSASNYNATTKSIDFTKMYLDLDTSLNQKMTDTSGSTAVTVLVTDTTVTCANVGDSRAVLCRADGSCVNLSEDHKPENPEERARIEAAGGHVADNRVNGELAMSRALGDFRYKRTPKLPVDKQLVIPHPEIVSVPREKGDKFLVIACDGIFDVLSNQEAVDFVRKELETEPDQPLEGLCKKMCLHCLAPEENGRPTRPYGTDNMTITIVLFK